MAKNMEVKSQRKRKREFMDDLDFKIVYELDRNSRISNMQIAKKLGVSEGTVRKRIHDLVDCGIIKKFTIEFGIKRGLKAFVLIKYKIKDPKRIMEFLRSLPEVKSVYQLTGQWDVIIRVFTESSYEFNRVIDKIRSIPWIMETESLIVLDID